MRMISPKDEVPVVYNKRISHTKFRFEKKQNDSTEADMDFVGQLIKNYGPSEASAGPIWGGMTAASKALISHCLFQSPDTLNAYLNDMFATPLTYGFDQGHVVAEAVAADTDSARHALSMTIDKLLLLAQALSIVPYYNAEQGSWQFDGDADGLLDKIQAKITFDISFPSFYGGEYGVITKYGHMTDRSLMAIFVADHLAGLVPCDRAICEIGGGSGMLAFYLWRAGFRDVSIVDLPEVGLCQAYFLKRNLPSVPLILNDAFSRGRGGGAIGIYKTDLFQQALGTKWDVIVNVDSFPEMPEAVARDYLARSAANGWDIISINQESANGGQNVVPNLCDSIHDLRRDRRYPFWMRPGYVCEVYRSTRTTFISKLVRRLIMAVHGRWGAPIRASTHKLRHQIRVAMSLTAAR